MATNPLIGAWRLITVEDHQPDGSIIYPYGEKALGMPWRLEPWHAAFSLPGR